MAGSTLLLKASADMSTVMTFLPEMERCQLLGVLPGSEEVRVERLLRHHDPERPGDRVVLFRDVTELPVEERVVVAPADPVHRRLVGCLRGFQRRARGRPPTPAAGHDLRRSVGIRDAGLGSGHAAGQGQRRGQHEQQHARTDPPACCCCLSRPALPDCRCPCLLGACVLSGAMAAGAVLLARRRPAQTPWRMADFQHGIRVRRETGIRPPGRNCNGNDMRPIRS